MAEPSLSTRLSRRSMLVGGAVTTIAAPTFAALPAAAEDDARIAVLAAHYRQTTTALVDWIDEVERRHGPFAYEALPEYRGRYEALAALDQRCTEALARAWPATLHGLVLKLRPAFYCDSLYDAEPDCDADILLAALHDLERLAAEAGRAAPQG